MKTWEGSISGQENSLDRWPAHHEANSLTYRQKKQMNAFTTIPKGNMEFSNHLLGKPEYCTWRKHTDAWDHLKEYCVIISGI